MSSMIFLVDFIFGLYLMIVLMRLWLQLAQADFYNSFSQFIVKATHPIVAPMRRVIPPIGRLDTATLLLALVVAMLKFFCISLVAGSAYTNIVGLLTLGAIQVVKSALQMVMWVLIIRAILSWVSQGQNPIEYVFHQLTEPFLRPIRSILPPMGGLDLSVMLALFVVIFLQKLLTDLTGIAW